MRQMNGNRDAARDMGKVAAELFLGAIGIALFGLAVIGLIFIGEAIWLIERCRSGRFKADTARREPVKRKLTSADFGPGSLDRAYWLRKL